MIGKSLFGYYGGKTNIAKFILDHIPNHMIYVEPFCGSASILFSKPVPNVANYSEVINDHDKNLINFFTKLRDNGDELRKKLDLTLYSKNEYNIRNDETCDDLERARRYFVNISQSFSSKLNGGWAFAYDRNHSSTFRNRVNKIDWFINRLGKVNIESLNAIDCILKWDTSKTFFYIDPPYINADQGHYKGFTEDDFYKLVDVLKSIKGSMALSNYKMDNMPKDWELKTHKTYCSASYKKNDPNLLEERIEYLWIKKADEVDNKTKKLYKKMNCFKGSKSKQGMLL